MLIFFLRKSLTSDLLESTLRITISPFELNVNGYSGPYNYEVFDSTSTSVFGVINANTSTNPTIVTGLIAGTYHLTVTDTNGCTKVLL